LSKSIKSFYKQAVEEILPEFLLPNSLRFTFAAAITRIGFSGWEIDDGAIHQP
jgi:hypothetical protein